MIHVEASTHVERPAPVVFSYIADLSRMPEWMDVIEGSFPSETPTRVGTVVTNEIHLLRRHFRNRLEVVEHEPDRRLTLKSSEPFEVEARFLVEPEARGSVLSVVFEAQPSAGAFFRLGEPILTRVATRRFKGHLRRVKQVLETADARPVDPDRAGVDK